MNDKAEAQMRDAIRVQINNGVTEVEIVAMAKEFAREWIDHRTQQTARAIWGKSDDRDAYEISDPKHPDHHDTYADVWDNREGK